jgi:PAS domain S-box-containing protein
MRDTLRELCEQTPDAMLALDREGRYLYVNPVAERVVGRPADRLLGASPFELFAGPRVERFREVYERVRASGGAESYVERTGQGTWFEVSVFPLSKGTGVLLRDVTANAEREAEATRIAELREQLLAIVGHDLRTPLAVVATGAQLLLRTPAVAGHAAARDTLERVLNASRRMQRMIAQLLDLTRVRLGGGVELAPGATSLLDLFYEVRDQVQFADASARLRATLRGRLDGTWDHDRLYEVLSNLLANALRHSDPESPVELLLDGSGDPVVLEVKNHGPAIAPELLPVLFEPFRRSYEPKKRGDGLGLGLFISKEFVVAHGGTIEARSDERATTFTVRLPRVAPHGPRRRDPHAVASPRPEA